MGSVPALGRAAWGQALVAPPGVGSGKVCRDPEHPQLLPERCSLWLASHHPAEHQTLLAHRAGERRSAQPRTCSKTNASLCRGLHPLCLLPFLALPQHPRPVGAALLGWIKQHGGCRLR